MGDCKPVPDESILGVTIVTPFAVAAGLIIVPLVLLFVRRHVYPITDRVVWLVGLEAMCNLLLLIMAVLSNAGVRTGGDMHMLRAQIALSVSGMIVMFALKTFRALHFTFVLAANSWDLDDIKEHIETEVKKGRVKHMGHAWAAELQRPSLFAGSAWLCCSLRKSNRVRKNKILRSNLPRVSVSTSFHKTIQSGPKGVRYLLTSAAKLVVLLVVGIVLMLVLPPKTIPSAVFALRFCVVFGYGVVVGNLWACLFKSHCSTKSFWAADSAGIMRESTLSSVFAIVDLSITFFRMGIGGQGLAITEMISSMLCLAALLHLSVTFPVLMSFRTYKANLRLRRNATAHRVRKVQPKCRVIADTPGEGKCNQTPESIAS